MLKFFGLSCLMSDQKVSVVNQADANLPIEPPCILVPAQTHVF